MVVQARGFNGAEPENSIVWSYTTLHNSPTHDAAPPAQADPIEFSDDDEPSQDEAQSSSGDSQRNDSIDAAISSSGEQSLSDKADEDLTLVHCET